MPLDISECLVEKTDSIVKVEEKRSKASFNNKERQLHKIYDNDKCVMGAEDRKADYVIHKSGFGELIVELKGRSVEHAVSQVSATYSFWKQNNLFSGPEQAALIVCKQVPHALAAQRAQETFKRAHKKKIRVLTHCEERDFSEFI